MKREGYRAENPAYLSQNIRFLCIAGRAGTGKVELCGGLWYIVFCERVARAAALCGMLVGLLEGKW